MGRSLQYSIIIMRICVWKFCVQRSIYEMNFIPDDFRHIIRIELYYFIIRCVMAYVILYRPQLVAIVSLLFLYGNRKASRSASGFFWLLTALKFKLKLKPNSCKWNEMKRKCRCKSIDMENAIRTCLYWADGND